MRGMGCASFTVAALSCLKSTQNRRLPFFFLTMTTGEAQGLLEGWMTPLDSIYWTCAISSRRTVGFGSIWLVKWRSVGLDGMFQERCTASIVLSLAHNVAEFLKEILQLLLLSGRQVCRDGRQATRWGGDWWRRSIGDGDNF